jgi:hypothetical protein
MSNPRAYEDCLHAAVSRLPRTALRARQAAAAFMVQNEGVGAGRKHDKPALNHLPHMKKGCTCRKRLTG